MGLFSVLFGNSMQYAHDTEMYLKNRKDFIQDRNHAEIYNSPSAQVQRLRDAGLNPTLAMSNIQTGQVNTPNSPYASPSQFAPIANGLTEGVLHLLGVKSELEMKAAQTRAISADAKAQEIYNETAARENLVRIHKIEGEGRESWKRGDHIDPIETARYNDFLSQIGERASRTELNWALYATQMQELKYLPIDKSLNWIDKIGSIQESYTRQELNRAQTKKAIEETTAAIFGWKDKKFQFELNKKTERYLTRQRKFDSSPKSFQHGLGAGALELGDGINSIFDLW